jgi:hypothetical protein
MSLGEDDGLLDPLSRPSATPSLFMERRDPVDDDGYWQRVATAFDADYTGLMSREVLSHHEARAVPPRQQFEQR